jgi:hypothetical protein
VGLLTLLALECGAVAYPPDTVWTGAANNGLWGDAGNWSNGMPNRNSEAEISKTITVDLGGVRREVERLELRNGGGFQNGTLASRFVYGFYSVPANVELTGLDGQLHISGNAVTPRIEGRVVGDGFDFFAAGLFTAQNTHTGPTISLGHVTLAEGGSMKNASAMRVIWGDVRLDNRIVNSPDRLDDAMPVELWGGASLTLVGNASEASSERVGRVVLANGGGIKFAQATTTPQPITLFASSLQRAPGTLGWIDQDLSRGERILFDQPPAALGEADAGPTGAPILPYLTGWFRTPTTLTQSLVTYDTGPNLFDPSDDVGLRPLNPATEFESQIPLSGPAKNVRLTTSQTVAAPATVNSLSVGPGLVVNDVLTVNSGSITLRESGLISGSGRLRVPGEAIISGDQDTWLAVPLEAQKLIVTGGITLTSANPIPGGAQIEGTVISRAAGALGSGDIRLNYGLLGFASVDQTLDNEIVLGSPLSTNYPFPFSPWFDPDITLKVETGHEVTLNGKIMGSGNVSIGGRGGGISNAGLFHFNGQMEVSDLNLFGFRNAIFEVNGEIRSNLGPQHIWVSANIRGEGTILGQIVGGNLSPGRDGLPGRMTVSRIGYLDDASTEFIVDIAGTVPGVQYDQLVVLDGITHSSYTNTFGILTVNLNYGVALGDRFLIMDNRSAGAIDGILNSLPEGTIFYANGIPLQISYVGGDGNDVTLTAVPEPALLSILLAMPMILVRRRSY